MIVAEVGGATNVEGVVEVTGTSVEPTEAACVGSGSMVGVEVVRVRDVVVGTSGVVARDVTTSEMMRHATSEAESAAAEAAAAFAASAAARAASVSALAFAAASSRALASAAALAAASAFALRSALNARNSAYSSGDMLTGTDAVDVLLLGDAIDVV